MRFVALTLLVAACATGTTSTSPAPTSSLPATTTSLPMTTTTVPPVDCPAPPYEVGVLPFGVGEGTVSAEEIEPDVWTSVGGTATVFFVREDGEVAIALIRGTLPALDWPDVKGEVEIDGTRAAVGPHPDGTWVAGWFEQPAERCDLYTMVFYPPITPPEVEQVLESMNRVGG